MPRVEPFEHLLAPRRCALLVVDMQNDNVSPEGRLARAGVDVTAVAELVPRVSGMLKLARAVAVPVLHSRTVTLKGAASDSPAWSRTKRRVVSDPELCLEGSWGAELHPDCAALPGEQVIDKRRSSAFHDTDLEARLRDVRAETVVIIGEQTPGCIEATFRDAPQHDFFAVLVADCVAGYDRRLHEIAIELQRARGDVCTVADVVSCWAPSVRTNEPGG